MSFLTFLFSVLSIFASVVALALYSTCAFSMNGRNACGARILKKPWHVLGFYILAVLPIVNLILIYKFVFVETNESLTFSLKKMTLTFFKFMKGDYK